MGTPNPALSAAAFGLGAAVAVAASGAVVRTGGLTALLAPIGLFAAAGYLGGLSLPHARAARASAVALPLGGVGSLLAIVGTQASLSAPFVVAFTIAWTVCGGAEAIALFTALGTDAATRRRRFMTIVGTFASAGVAGGLVCLAGLVRGGANDPLVDLLLVLGCAMPAAAGGASLADALSEDR